MGTYYTAGATVGFVLHFEDALAPFKVSRAATYRMEPRWDPKTGQPADPVKVVEEYGSTDYKFDGVMYGSHWEAIDAIAKYLGCGVHWDGALNGLPLKAIFSPFAYDRKQAQDYGRLTMHDNSFKLSASLFTACEELAVKLRQLGIEPGEPVFTTYCSWG